MKRRFHWSALLILLCLVPANARATGDGPLPIGWYRLPEDGGVYRSSPEEERVIRKKAAEAIERMLKANSEALDRVADSEAANPGLRDSEWKFAALVLNLGVSLSGTLGVLVAKGDASAALYWRRAQAARSPEPVFDASEEADLAFHGDESPRQVEAKLEPVIRAVLATGEVKDGGALRKNLLDVVLQYQGLVRNLSFHPGREWTVSKLRLDFSVDVSGKVSPAVTVGGAIRLRFEWDPGAGHRLAASTRDEKELGKLLATLSDAMSDLPYDELSHTGYELKSLKFGLGLFGNGKFGVVKAGASVMGHLYLSRKKTTHPIALPHEETNDSIPLIDVDSPPEHLAYAQSIGVRATAWSYGGSRGHVYSVPKQAFRKGMEKAVKMGAFLAERSRRSQGTKWDLYQIKAEFALSLSGTAGIVTLGGTGSLQMAFKKI